MRQGLRRALAEKTRLAALGAAMSRISHDLKNILATAVLISDRLEAQRRPRGAPGGAAPDRDAGPRRTAVRRDPELRPQRPAGARSRAASRWSSWWRRCATPWRRQPDGMCLADRGAAADLRL